MKILFICTGNTCRSAMAEALAKKIAKEKNLSIEICSAGIFAMKGEHASYNSIAIMKEYDVDIVLHRATPIDEIDLSEIDLILCATYNHKIQLSSKIGDMKSKIYTMKEYAGIDNNGEDYDIKDPWGNDLNRYRLCAAEISLCVDKIMEKIEQSQKM